MAQLHDTVLLEGVNALNGENDPEHNEYNMNFQGTDLSEYLSSKNLAKIYPSLLQMQLLYIKDVIVFTQNELEQLCGYLNIFGIDKFLFTAAVRTLQLQHNTLHCFYQSQPQSIPQPVNRNNIKYNNNNNNMYNNQYAVTDPTPNHLALPMDHDNTPLPGCCVNIDSEQCPLDEELEDEEKEDVLVNDDKTLSVSNDKSINITKCSINDTVYDECDGDKIKYEPIQSRSLYYGIKAIFDGLKQELSDIVENDNQNVEKVEEAQVDDKWNKENKLPPLRPKLRKRKVLSRNRRIELCLNKKENTPKGPNETPGKKVVNSKKKTKKRNNKKIVCRNNTKMDGKNITPM